MCFIAYQEWQMRGSPEGRAPAVAVPSPQNTPVERWWKEPNEKLTTPI